MGDALRTYNGHAIHSTFVSYQLNGKPATPRAMTSFNRSSGRQKKPGRIYERIRRGNRVP
jgi:hypothetical protein